MLKKTLLCLLVMVALLVGACGGKEVRQNERPITVYLFTVEMLRDYAPYIQAQLPDVELQFVVGNNDLDFYKFLKEQGSLPDIFISQINCDSMVITPQQQSAPSTSPHLRL